MLRGSDCLAESKSANTGCLRGQHARCIRKGFRLGGQIQRASVSIMSNIAEGFECGRMTEFHQFLSIAKGSCAEVRSQLYVALDAGYLTKENFDPLLEQAN